MKECRKWQKVLLGDLPSIAFEVKNLLTVPSVLILSGEMGVGKTTFTSSFYKVLNQCDLPTITSPTYSMIEEYGSLVHADFYRVKDKEEIYYLEIPLYLEHCDYFVAEWGENFLSTWSKEIPDSFTFYQLDIEHYSNSDADKADYRNYQLQKLALMS